MIIATLIQTASYALASTLMREQGQLDPFEMVFFTGPIAFLTLLPFVLKVESAELGHALAAGETRSGLLSFLLGTSILAAVYNVLLSRLCALSHPSGPRCSALSRYA